MKKLDNFIINPNVIWMLPPEPMDENEPVNLAQALTPRCPNLRMESGKLVRFSGENEFSVKIGGTTYEVSTHFSDTGRQSVLEQFKNLILSEQLIG
mgnify:FL=1